MENERGIVYLLKNECMPGWIKIGITTDLKKRVKELFTTALPTSFDCVYACEVENYKFVEEKIHFAFGKFRPNPKREFFKDIEPERIIAVLSLLNPKDVTASVNERISAAVPADERAADLAAKAEIRQRRLRLNFATLGINKGEKLLFIDDDTIVVEVVDERQVSYAGQKYSLTGVTKLIKGQRGEYNKNISGTLSWRYNGQPLDDICDEKLRMQPLDE